jgi:hypothetical protein
MLKLVTKFFPRFVISTDTSPGESSFVKKKKEETKVALHISYFILKLMYLFMNSATIKILSKKNVIVINLFNNCSLKSEHDDNYFNKINITNKAHLVDKAIS